MIKRLLIAVVVVIVACAAYAAPSITNVTGPVTEGGVLSITGIDLGPNPLTHEFLHNHIDSATSGDAFSETDWYNTTDTTSAYAVRYTNTEAHSGSNSVVAKFENSVTAHYLSYIAYNQGAIPYGTDMFISFWLKPAIELTGLDSMQLKLWRMRPSADQSNQDTNFAQSIWYDANIPAWFQSGQGFRITQTPSLRVSCSADLAAEEFPDIDEWNKMEYQVTKNSANGVSDGSYQIWTNQQLAIDEQSCETHDATSDDWNNAIFGYEYSNGDATPSLANIYFDDIYIAFTPARFAICSESTWAACTGNDIQDTTAQTDTTATITFNQGNYADSSTVYIYAIDEDNVVSTAGYELTIAAGTEPVVALQSDFSATSPTSYTGSFTVEVGRTGTLPVSSNGFTVTCDDGDCTNEETEAFTVTGVAVPITDTITVTDSSAEEGSDSITISLIASGDTTVGTGTSVTVGAGTAVEVGG